MTRVIIWESVICNSILDRYKQVKAVFARAREKDVTADKMQYENMVESFTYVKKQKRLYFSMGVQKEQAWLRHN